MNYQISAAQKSDIERAMIAPKVPLIARRLRADFPQTTARVSDTDLLVFTRTGAGKAARC